MAGRGAVALWAVFHRFSARAAAREQAGSPPDIVAEAILEALAGARPAIRYRAGKDAALPAMLPDRLLDALRLKMRGQPTGFGTASGEAPPRHAAGNCVAIFLLQRSRNGRIDRTTPFRGGRCPDISR